MFRYSPLFLLIAGLPVSSLHAAEEQSMVVSATGFAQKIQDAPASISVITKQQIADKAYRDVTDALKDVPGVVVTGGGSSSDISIRGMAGKYTLFLVNGKRVSTRSTRPNSDGPAIPRMLISLLLPPPVTTTPGTSFSASVTSRYALSAICCFVITEMEAGAS